ncbi:MAG: hypothetical protein ACNS61_07270, partial [Candidatus Wenzhouxiangella sp. M2_3B_020]
ARCGGREGERMARKYHAENLLPALRLFIEARNKAVESGFTDNGGAIHSVERILDILSLYVCFPHLTHINSLKSDPAAEISAAAQEARQRGEPLFIEHVLPQRAYARKVIELVNSGARDKEVLSFIRENYRLVVSVRCDCSDGVPPLSIMSMIDNGHLEALHDGHEGAEEAVLV